MSGLGDMTLREAGRIAWPRIALVLGGAAIVGLVSILGWHFVESYNGGATWVGFLYVMGLYACLEAYGSLRRWADRRAS